MFQMLQIFTKAFLYQNFYFLVYLVGGKCFLVVILNCISKISHMVKYFSCFHFGLSSIVYNIVKYILFRFLMILMVIWVFSFIISWSFPLLSCPIPYGVIHIFLKVL